jgi:hypothetical protein
MSMPEMTTEELASTTREVTVEHYLETLYGIRPGESWPRMAVVANRYRFVGNGLDDWLHLWGLGDSDPAPSD